MPSKIISINEPQDIYVLTSFPYILEDKDCLAIIGITDDYATIDFKCNGEVIAHTETVGSLAFFTKDQILTLKAKLDSDEDDESFIEHFGLDYETGYPEIGMYGLSDTYGLILRNFSGDLLACYTGKSGKCYLNNYDVTKQHIMSEGIDEDGRYVVQKFDTGGNPSYKQWEWCEDLKEDSEEFLSVPEGVKVDCMHVYQVFDEAQGATWMNVDRVESEEEILSIMILTEEITKRNFFDLFTFNCNLTFVRGYLCGIGFLDHTHKLVDITERKEHLTLKTAMNVHSDHKRNLSIMAHLISSIDVYKDRFHKLTLGFNRPREKFYAE